MGSEDSRGWLHEDYRLFHSVDQRDMDFQTHYHDFHKVVVCLGGSVTYIMEGSAYRLGAGDVLIIPQHRIHRSILRSSEIYERMILWIRDDFLTRFQEKALKEVFDRLDGQRRDFLHPDGADWTEAVNRLRCVENCQAASFEGHRLMADTYLIQFLLNLFQLRMREQGVSDARVSSDPGMNRILSYIGSHLAEDLSISALAGRFYVSPSHLMRAFRAHTGCTIHQYVLQKRLIRAAEAIRAGEAVTDAAREAGFSDYSVFLRAFRRQYACAPRELRAPKEK